MKPFCVNWGQRLLGIAMVCMVVGGVVAGMLRKVLPGVFDRGLTPVVLCILIPIWTIALAGIALSTAGWITNPRIAPRIELDYERRPDGGILARPIKLAGAALCAALIPLFVWLMARTWHDEHFWRRNLGIYAMVSLCAFIFYMAAFYSEKRHPVTTTYLNLYMGLFAFVMIPVLWPLLVILSLRPAKDAPANPEADQ
jgi:drug/metabolite transporter (DMT)-like permease